MNVFSQIALKAVIPINKSAALVVSKGDHWTPNKKIQTKDSEFPLLHITESSKPETARILKKLVGIKFGRLTVMGLSIKWRGRWIVRCSCGIYTTRKAKSITKATNKFDRCERCRALTYQKIKYHYETTGEQLNMSDF